MHGNSVMVGLLKKVIALAEATISAVVFRPSDSRSARSRQVSKSALRLGIGPFRFGAFFNSPMVIMNPPGGICLRSPLSRMLRTFRRTRRPQTFLLLTDRIACFRTHRAALRA
jgi:hypothetical protein